MGYLEGGAFLSGALPGDLDLAPLGHKLGFIPLPPAWSELASFCMDRYEYPNQGGEMPRSNVTFLQARALCAEQGKRLCSEAEFDRACGGLEGWHQPYGPDQQLGRCNDDVVEGIGEETWLATSGAFWQCESPEGIYDLEGNLSEWVDSSEEIDARPTPRLPAELSVGAEHTVDASAVAVRGGTMWVAIYGSGCHARHLHPMSGPTSNDDGFRCCLDAPAPPSPPREATP